MDHSFDRDTRICRVIFDHETEKQQQTVAAYLSYLACGSGSVEVKKDKQEVSFIEFRAASDILSIMDIREMIDLALQAAESKDA